MTLRDTKAGQKGIVLNVSGDSMFQRRISAVGIIPGGAFEVIRSGGHSPMLLHVRNTMLAVSSVDCSQIEVEVK